MARESFAKIPEGSGVNRGEKQEIFAKIPDETVAEPNVDADNVRQALQRVGFVRVDGLIQQTVDGRRTQIPRSFAKNSPEIWGNNGIMSVRFRNGEVWAGLGNCIKSVEEIENLIKEGAIKREGYFVPLSNGESLYFWDLYRRMRDPDWIPGEIYRSDLSWRP